VLPQQFGMMMVLLWVTNSNLVPAVWLRALGAVQEKPTIWYISASRVLCLEIRANRQSQCNTLTALFYCCLTAEIAEQSRKRLALLLHGSSRTCPAAGDGRTLCLLCRSSSSKCRRTGNIRWVLSTQLSLQQLGYCQLK